MLTVSTVRAPSQAVSVRGLVPTCHHSSVPPAEMSLNRYTEAAPALQCLDLACRTPFTTAHRLLVRMLEAADGAQYQPISAAQHRLEVRADRRSGAGRASFGAPTEGSSSRQ
jgi:hypothetical protein